jgi:1,6-anhydro-N-acetylmuramate kinase
MGAILLPDHHSPQEYRVEDFFSQKQPKLLGQAAFGPALRQHLRPVEGRSKNPGS